LRATDYAYLAILPGVKNSLYVRILEINEPGKLKVDALEVLNNTPVLDIKPAIH
jgi:hypothetical protein